MNEYEERQEARRERYLERAEAATQEAGGRYNAAKRLADQIPMGQPILVGHHSEKRHRADLRRIDTNMRKSIEARDKAKHYANKAAGVGRAGISSDDPDALAKLEEKLARLEAEQETMKRVNRQYKKGGWDAVEGLSDALKAACKRTLELCPYHKRPYPSYALQINSGNMRRIRQRIEQLGRQADMTEAAPVEHDGFTVRESKDLNRICFEFDSKPPKAICQIMRSNGWRWSRTAGAWLRHLNNAGRYAAEYTGRQVTAGLCGPPEAETH